MLQGNLSQDDPPAVLKDEYVEGYVRMLEGMESPEADLLILPESPSPVMYQVDPKYRGVLENLSRKFTFGMIFNNIRRDDSTGSPIYFNSAYFLDGSGTPRGVYDKTHLVPFGEYIPGRDLFAFMQTITKDVGEFQRGERSPLFSIGGHPVSTTICFEDIFPALVRGLIRDGGELVVNLTNDGWYGASSAPFQHFNIARWRAIENRRYFLRSTNTGISAIIDPSGGIHGATKIQSRAVCEGYFGFVTEQTFYTRYGDAFILLCAIIVFGCTILVYAKGAKTGRRNNG
jgi:apolipoprotein N-acyltransferase